MASIVKRKRPSDGTIVYDARITVKRKGEIVHRESKTFSSKQIAQNWAKKKEKRKSSSS